MSRRDRDLLGPERDGFSMRHSGLHELDAAGPERLQQRPGGRLIELRIPRLDRNEEAVVAHPLEHPGAEERMVMHRQPVQREHAEHGAKRAEEDAQFEGDRDERRPGEKRLAADHEWIGLRVDPPLQAESQCGARQPHGEHDPGKRRPPQPHRLLDPVHGERRVRVPARESGVAHALAGMVEVRRRCELGEKSVTGSLRKLRRQELHPDTPSRAGSPWAGATRSLISRSGPAGQCGSACGSTVFTSAVATIGRKRTNKQNIVKNSPKLPSRQLTSHTVGVK